MVNETAIVKTNQVNSCVFSSYLQWNNHSPDLLDKSETTILSHVKKPFDRFFVPLGACVGADDQIWTLSMNTDNKNTPIVMLHGFGAGIAFWVMNLEEISENRPLFAIDLPGFGKSSRSNFSKKSEEIEEQFIKSIDRWRELMNIEKMILLGHSFGGYLSSLYALKHPQRIEHLILADPWGFTEKPDLSNVALWKRSLIHLFKNMRPLAVIRAAGPYGEWLVRRTRTDILRKYESVVEDQNVIAQYIHQCNSNRKSTGEEAFKNLLEGGPWAKNPIGEKLKDGLQDNIPLTFLYGAISWMNNTYGPIIQESRTKSYTHIENIEFAGHHVYSDNALDFNQFVNDACKILKSQ